VAPVLQCPDCGEKHPLSRVPESGAFPCQGCGRVLKVPEVVAQRAPAAPANGAAAAAAAAGARSGAAGAEGGTAPKSPSAGRPVPVATAVVSPNASADANATTAIPQLDQEALSAVSPDSKRFGRKGARLGRVPWWMRFILWVIAVPLGFIVVFAVARSFSLFTSNQLSDLFLANNPGRFWPAARLLPFVALVTASFVQGGVYLLARWRGRRSGASAAVGAGDVSGSRSRARRA
jgi:hypothetical protein